MESDSAHQLSLCVLSLGASHRHRGVGEESEVAMTHQFWCEGSLRCWRLIDSVEGPAGKSSGEMASRDIIGREMLIVLRGLAGGEELGRDGRQGDAPRLRELAGGEELRRDKRWGDAPLFLVLRWLSCREDLMEEPLTD